MKFLTCSKEGFQSSSQQQGGFLESPSSQREEKSFQQSLIPATIRQLYQASQDRPDDAFKIDGKEVHQVFHNSTAWISKQFEFLVLNLRLVGWVM